MEEENTRSDNSAKYKTDTHKMKINFYESALSQNPQDEPSRISVVTDLNAAGLTRNVLQSSL